MKNLTLRQFRYFDALARHGHFGRAADACAITQPALSQQIRDLEASLGAALFERTARSVRLTALGAALAPRIRSVLRSVEELGDIARAARGRLVGQLRIGAIPTVAPYLLPGLIGDLTREHPGLDVFVRETQTARLAQEVADGKLDLAIMALPSQEPAFAEAPLLTERFVLVRPASDAGKPAPGLDVLRDMRLLLLEEGHCFRDQALAFCKAQAAMPREVLEGSTLSTLVQMVGAGIGVTLIPEMAIPLETRSAQVSVARFAAPEPVRTIGVVWRRSNPMSDQLAEVAALARRSLMALGARRRPDASQ
jgi:LysR family hydrogen peroxide-inducible transcriptional activator